MLHIRILEHMYCWNNGNVVCYEPRKFFGMASFNSDSHSAITSFRESPKRRSVDFISLLVHRDLNLGLTSFLRRKRYRIESVNQLPISTDL